MSYTLLFCTVISLSIIAGQPNRQISRYSQPILEWLRIHNLQDFHTHHNNVTTVDLTVFSLDHVSSPSNTSSHKNKEFIRPLMADPTLTILEQDTSYQITVQTIVTVEKYKKDNRETFTITLKTTLPTTDNLETCSLDRILQHIKSDINKAMMKLNH